MARLQPELLERIETFCDRILAVAGTLSDAKVSFRLIDQMVAAGTAVGANLFEADEAMSRADFVKCLAIASKELNETRFWLRLVCRQGWVAPSRVEDLTRELLELKKVLGSIIARTKKASKPIRAS